VKKKLLGLAVVLFSLSMIAAACGDSEDSGSSSGGNAGTEAPKSEDCGKLPNEKPPTGGEFVDYAQLSDAGSNTTFDPGAVQTLDEAQITSAVWDSLTDFDFSDKCNPKLVGSAASEWKNNADATEFTFTVKDGLKFSNGEPVLPSNFKLGWERMGSAELASPYGYLMAYVKDGDKLIDGSMKTLDSIVADDKAMTLKVTLASPNADFPSIVSMQEFSPIDKGEYAKIGNTTGWGAKGLQIGNGPFKIESADEQKVVLVPNSEWAGDVYGTEKPALSKLTFMISQDLDSAYQSFQAGEGQSATIPSGLYQDAMSKYPNTVKSPTMGSYFFDYGFNDPVLSGDKNLKLRQAISLAIDRDDINKKVYEGTRNISTGITPPGIPGFKRGLCKYCEYNPTEAKKLYDEWKAAGNSLTAPIKVQYNPGGGHADVVQVMGANLKTNLGIDIQPSEITEKYFREVAKEGACNICRSGWYADYPTYGNFMVDLFGKVSIDGNNLGRFDNPEFEAAIAKAQAETDDVKRGELYNEAEDILLNKAVNAIPLNWYVGDQVYAKGTVNYDQPPLGLILWQRIGVEK